MPKENKLTPMMEQYMEIKARHKDDILMYRLGDFFEFFFDDAKTVSRELGIALTARDCGLAERAPMCGVPAHAADAYIAKLTEKGYRIAICDQIEDPKHAKGIVARDVVRIVTPGTITDANYLEEGRHNFIVAVHSAKGQLSLAVADISTGLFMATAMPTGDEQKLFDEIVRLAPRELLLPEEYKLTRIIEQVAGLRATAVPIWTYNQSTALKCLTGHFGTFNLEGFGIRDNSAEVCAAGALLAYLIETQKNALSQITALRTYSFTSHMLIDAASRRNLELTASMRDFSKKGSLLWVLDSTRTAMGARLLRSWVECPLATIDAITTRQESVAEWVQMPIEREEIREHLYNIHDMERVVARLATRNSTARDLITLRNSLLNLPRIEQLLKNVQSKANREMRVTYDDLQDICQEVSCAIVDTPPQAVKEGGMIRPGYNSELDSIMHTKNSAQEYLTELETRERERTGIANLKVRFNRVFGYYIEVTASHLAKVPSDFIRKQTLANCERFYTSELKKLEETLLGADEKICDLEYELFDAVRRSVVEKIPRIQFMARCLSTLDALQSLAHVADTNGYTRPNINEGSSINITAGRHPVVERISAASFVPNDTEIDSSGARLMVVTGPNMAGKSTYMRQVALIVLMAQIGSFVPCAAADIGIADRIFTRVGASDDLATGQSTFMVEMTEVANILHNATNKSLVLLDEIGRGTSTFDGLSIAWAVLEYIANPQIVGARTLFATHYHELTQLEGKIDGVKNYCFAVQESGKDIIFLRKLMHGAAGKSYGIHVAKLAGLPPQVLRHAAALLSSLNESGISKAPLEPLPPPQQTRHEILDAIDAIELESMTPIEAMLALEKLKNFAKTL